MANIFKNLTSKYGQFLLVVISALIAINLAYENWAAAGQGDIYLGAIGASVLLVVLFAVLAFKSDNNRISH